MNGEIVSSDEHEVWGTDPQGTPHPWRASAWFGCDEFACSGWDVNVSSDAVFALDRVACIALERR
jgi:hypothetical protein